LRATWNMKMLTPCIAIRPFRHANQRNIRHTEFRQHLARNL
jgi:hypothetical protein